MTPSHQTGEIFLQPEEVSNEVSTKHKAALATTLHEEEDLVQTHALPIATKYIESALLSTQKSHEHGKEPSNGEVIDCFRLLTENLPSLSGAQYENENENDEDFEEMKAIISEFPTITSIVEAINEDVFKEFVEHHLTQPNAPNVPLVATFESKTQMELTPDQQEGFHQIKRELSDSDDQRAAKRCKRIERTENEANQTIANSLEKKNTAKSMSLSTTEVDIENLLRNKLNFENKENLCSEIREFVCEHLQSILGNVTDVNGKRKIFDKLYELAPEECQQVRSGLLKEAVECESSLKVINKFTEHFVSKKFNFENPETLQSQISDCLYNHIKKCLANNGQLKCTWMYIKYIFPKLNQRVPDLYKKAKDSAIQRIRAELNFVSNLLDWKF